LSSSRVTVFDRPRPAVLGEDPSFNTYAERIHRAFLKMGVIKY